MLGRVMLPSIIRLPASPPSFSLCAEVAPRPIGRMWWCVGCGWEACADVAFDSESGTRKGRVSVKYLNSSVDLMRSWEMNNGQVQEAI